MNIPKQFINLLGLVLVVAVVVAGVALIALPLYGNAQTTLASAKTVGQSNDVYQTQVDALTTAAGDIDQIDAHVAELRTEITTIAQLDDVHELIASAAETAGATVVTVTASDAVAWQLRTSVGEQGEATAEEPKETAAADDPSTDSTTEESEAATDTAGTDAASTPAKGELGPQQQVPITIDVEVADAKAAAAFVDALGAGPRLIGINSSVLDGDADALTLTISALAFIRTED